ncbi:MAG: type II toxin-antitoxin system RelE/ParE family toxin [Opitutae bacterium]|nr:type II toxin-antitoxin system RelE/ParE family toxin [Opitutae bacterium]
MVWRVELEEDAKRDLHRLGADAARKIVSYLRARLATAEDPRRYGRSLRGDLHGLWRYRVADYRVLAKIEKERLLVLVVRVGHRKDVYE